MKNYSIILIALLGLVLYSCSDDEEIMTTSCETENLTYTNDIAAIINSSCAASSACHIANATQTFSMSNFAETSAAVSLGRISGAINQLTGFSPMPRNAAKLDDCTIAMIDQWLDDGAPE